VTSGVVDPNAAIGTLTFTAAPTTNVADLKNKLISAISTAVAGSSYAGSTTATSIAARITVNSVTFNNGQVTIQFTIASSSDTTQPSSSTILAVLANAVQTSSASADTVATAVSGSQLEVTQQNASGQSVTIQTLSSTGGASGASVNGAIRAILSPLAVAVAAIAVVLA